MIMIRVSIVPTGTEASEPHMLQLRRIEPGDIGRLFPMADTVSARLMKIKARCLCAAGVLPAALREQVNRRADDMIFPDRAAVRCRELHESAKV
jgi:hypothetical protein